MISLLLAALYPAFAPNTGVELGQLGPSRNMAAILSPCCRDPAVEAMVGVEPAGTVVAGWCRHSLLQCYRVALLPKAIQRLDENGGELAWKRGGALNEVWPLHQCMVGHIGSGILGFGTLGGRTEATGGQNYEAMIR